jgi:Holliday junction resolvase RusA-like endonuclease
MRDIIINIPGEPVAQARSRSTKSGHHYDPQKKLKDGIKLMIKSQVQGMEPLTGPLTLQCEFRMKRPKSHYGTGKNSETLKPSSPYYHIIRPDVDNQLKFVMDCLTGIVWIDDCQVCVVKDIRKIYADIKPNTYIKIGRV